MPVTLRQVARQLNLSITTVSRALDGYDDVAESTRRRVQRVARAMGYVPSRAARQLRRQRSDIIGYVIPTESPRFTDPFFSEFIAGLGDEAASRDLDLLVSTAPPDTRSEKDIFTRWVQSRLVDGVVLSRMRVRDWRVHFLVKNAFPFVVHGHTRTRGDFPLIDLDARAGFKQLVEHLAGHGHRRIAYIGAPARFTLQADRFAGYQDGLAAVGIEFDPALVQRGDLTRQGGYQATLQLLQLPAPPTAILGVNDLTALGAMRAARERGLVVGRDLAVAGYDGTDDAEHAQPPLTTLRQPVYETARRLVSMLTAVISGQPLTEPEVILKPELIVRESTGGT